MDLAFSVIIVKRQGLLISYLLYPELNLVPFPQLRLVPGCLSQAGESWIAGWSGRGEAGFPTDVLCADDLYVHPAGLTCLPPACLPPVFFTQSPSYCLSTISCQRSWSLPPTVINRDWERPAFQSFKKRSNHSCSATSPVPAQHQSSHASECGPRKISRLCLPEICHFCESFANGWRFGSWCNFNGKNGGKKPVRRHVMLWSFFFSFSF